MTPPPQGKKQWRQGGLLMQYGQEASIMACRQSLGCQNGTPPLNWEGGKLPHCRPRWSQPNGAGPGASLVSSEPAHEQPQITKMVRKYELLFSF